MDQGGETGVNRKDITPDGSAAPVVLDDDAGEPRPGLLLTTPGVDELRLAAYRETADPLFFKWQRGEATEHAWLEEVAAIRTRYPKSEV